MATAQVRKIIRIDEEKCDGCGECIPSCAEGALRIVDGKARLVSESFCDGMGACLGNCPTGALTIEERPAEAFDSEAVEQVQRRAEREPAPLTLATDSSQAGGCPGSRFRAIGTLAGSSAPALPRSQPQPRGGDAAAEPAAAGEPLSAPSRLRHWPVQLALLPPVGPVWDGADVLIAADCVPFALADFHESLLAGRSLAIACPKLDDVRPYVEKLAVIFSRNQIRSITVAHMEVPCCGGIVWAVEEALARSGRTDIPVTDVTIGVDGRRIGAAGRSQDGRLG